MVEAVAGDFTAKVQPQLEAQLESGETLCGIIAATHQKTFSGSLYAIGVTDRRLLLQPLDRRLQPKGQAKAVSPDTLVEATAGGAGDGSWSLNSIIVDAAATKLELRTTDGERLKLLMMDGGDGLLRRLGGGEAQRDGIQALAAFFRQHAPA